MYFDHVFRAPSEAFHSRKTLIDRYFKLAENQTTIKQEMLGGLTTFVTMAYIIVVNPQILAQAGMPPEGVLFATCISADATLVMGLYANYPICSCTGNVAECLLHLCRLPQHACSLEDRAGGSFPFRHGVPAAGGDRVREQIV
jgi:hypothetical protein